MSQTVRIVLFLCVVFLSNVMQAITGFAGTVLAMPFSVILIGGETARTILNVLGIAASLGVAVMNFRSIRWKEVLKICLIMAVGMVGGYLIIAYAGVEKNVLYFILAGFVLLFTAIGIYTTFFGKEKEREGKSLPEELLLCVLLLAAGVVHGMFVCGGPLLIIYATKKLKARDEFRSTLSTVWVILNGVNLVRDVLSGAFSTDTKGTLSLLGLALVALVVAVAVGNLIAKRLNKKVFMGITYGLMAVSAVSLILNACGVF